MKRFNEYYELTKILNKKFRYKLANMLDFVFKTSN